MRMDDRALVFRMKLSADKPFVRRNFDDFR